MSQSSECKHCGAELPGQSGPGRPRVYCSDPCKWRHSKRRKRTRAKELVRATKNVPCADCGLRFPHYVMDFDHRDPREKTHSLSQIHKATDSLKKIATELAKCDVVCANCHRIRTHK